MDKQITPRIELIDALKGLAIIAVALYHFGSFELSSGGGLLSFKNGILPYGYLGVDVFFVISGFLLIHSLQYKFETNSFHCFSFLFNKLIRLWPLVLLLAGVSLALGFILMLPDDYENLAESVVASSVFANNVLACITTSNYWDIVNLYKPLMHLWYVGVLMQAFVFLPFLYIGFIKIFKNDVRKGILLGTSILTVGSLLIYLLPFFSTAWKFYYLPFRIFEITVGGLVALLNNNSCNYSANVKKIVTSIAFVFMLYMIFSRHVVISKEVMLVTVVLSTALMLFFAMDVCFCTVINKGMRISAVAGKASYSIYVWHQFIIAFLFYSFFYKNDALSLPVFCILTLCFSVISYRYIELPLNKLIKSKMIAKVVVYCSAVTAIVLCAISLWIYFHAGVVRDVPELNIKFHSAKRNMHSVYSDKVYKWDRDFLNKDTCHILVLGNSFGRDWANILYEYDKGLDISYIYYSEDNLLKRTNRIPTADFVFYAMGPGYGGVPNAIIANIPSEKLFIVGNKNYGESNGIFYAKKGNSDYYDQTVKLPPMLLEENTKEARFWGSHYVDMLAPITNTDGNIRIFTDDKKFISQDCRHLTQAGAQYYARILNLGKILKK